MMTYHFHAKSAEIMLENNFISTAWLLLGFYNVIFWLFLVCYYLDFGNVYVIVQVFN